MAIWQDLVSDYGFASSYQSVKRYIHKRRGSQLPQAMAVILTAPGETHVRRRGKRLILWTNKPCTTMSCA
jgi:hypothetical protein